MFIFSCVATTALLFITGLLTELSLLNAIMIVLLSSLQAPFIALIMATFSSNKVEGFVIMKLTGLTLIGPIVSLFLTDWTELLLSIFPGFFQITHAHDGNHKQLLYIFKSNCVFHHWMYC